MAKTLKPTDLAGAIEQELTLYHEEVTENVNDLSKQAVDRLVKKTKATAPEGARGQYKKNITGKRLNKGKNGDTYVWYVKPPDHRLTHLLVHGHATKDGGRTKADPFLKDALDEVLPEYEEAVKEAIKR